MDEFGYLSVLLSIIIGLAITQLLLGFRGLVLSRARVATYAPPIVWSVTLVLIAVQSWWAMFGLREHTTWTFLQFAVVLAQTIVLYMLAGLVLPDFAGEQRVDLRAHYFEHRRVFFGVAVVSGLVSLTKDLVISGHLPNAPNVAFHVFYIGTAIAAMATAREWYHRALAPLMLAIFCVYIAVLFTRLPG
jgi:hypothetical protein